MKRLLTVFACAAFFASASPALAADTTRPVVGAPSPTSATAGVAVTMTASVSDSESGIASCNLYVESEDVGMMTVSSGTASKPYVYPQVGVYTVFVFCRDLANNFQSGPNSAVVVSAAQGDTSPPSVGSITPVTATAGFPVTLSATATDSQSGVAGCTLYVDGWDRGTMTFADGIASISYTFADEGNYVVYAHCHDLSGRAAAGPATTVTVSKPTPPNPSSRLIKLACPAGADANHPCKAVYYQGADGKRHAFPNAKVYFSWYADFDSVEEVSSAEMSALMLGKQVTYKPGYKLVKFETLNKVYAVSKGALLRWITSEEVASELYGIDWNTKVDDINDVFYLDYSFGPDITKSQDYNPTSESSSTPTIDSNL